MELDVVIPLRRAALVDRVLRSFALGAVQPSAILLVSNDVDGVPDAYGMDVRVVSFHSARYAYGEEDVVLRRNVGIWASDASHVLLFDDDQLAPRDLVATMMEKLGHAPVVWGNYRYLDFATARLDDIVALPPERGRSRERPAGAWHAWMSAYGGACGLERALVQSLGGFDMAYLGRHAGEDQQLARRIARHTLGQERIFVHEPPFVWHPTTREPWARASRNTCTAHTFRPEVRGRFQVQACSVCPAVVYERADLASGDCILPFDFGAVTYSVRRLGGEVAHGRQ